MNGFGIDYHTAIYGTSYLVNHLVFRGAMIDQMLGRFEIMVFSQRDPWKSVMSVVQSVFSEILKDYGIADDFRFELESGEVELIPEWQHASSPERRELLAFVVIVWTLTCDTLARSLAANRYVSGAHESHELRQMVCVFTQHPNDSVPYRTALALKHMAVACEEYVLGGCEDKFRVVLEDIISDTLRSRELAQGFIDPVANLERFLRLYGKILWNLYRLPVSFRSWFAVDLDGSSPQYIGRKQIVEADRTLRNFAIDRYQELLIGAVQLLRDEGGAVNRRITSLLLSIHDSLEATRRGVQGAKQRDSKSYGDVRAFLADVDSVATLVHEVLEPGTALLATSRILEMVHLQGQKFGFHFLEFQPRINAKSLEPLIEQVYVAQNHKTLPQGESERIEALQGVFDTSPTVDISSLGTLSEVSRWVVDCLSAFSTVQQRRCGVNRTDVCNGMSSIVVASFEKNSTLVGLKWLLRAFCLNCDVIGLVETEDALEKVDQLFEQRYQVEGPSPEPVVNFLGGSDTIRMLGVARGWWVLYLAQRRVIAVAQTLEQPIEQYYGRADHPARWGGSMIEFVQVQCSGSGRFHALVQGADKVATLTSFDMAQSWYHELCSTRGSESDIIDDEELRCFMESWTQEASSVFKGIVMSENFPIVMRRTLLFDVDIVRASSRPMARGISGAATDSNRQTWESRRAIATIQAGAIAGYIFQLMGTGAGLARAIEIYGSQRLTELYSTSTFFRFMLDRLNSLYEQVDLENFVRLSEGLEDFVIEEIFNPIVDDTNLARRLLQDIRKAPLRKPNHHDAVCHSRRQFVELFKASGWSVPQSERELDTPSPMAALAVSVLAGLGTSG